MKLFKRTATGAVQVWWVEVSADRYRTHSGKLGGKIVTSAWTVCVGKNTGRSNETTPEEQAQLEAAAMRTKKLEREGYRESADEAVSSTRFRPMLAHKFEDRVNKITYPVWSQPKLDGIRCIATKDGLWTRKGVQIVTAPHIERVLEPFFSVQPDLVLDGELYNHELRDDFNAITSLVRKTKPTELDLRNSEEMIEFHIFDVPSMATPLFGSRYGEYFGIVESGGWPLVAVESVSVSNAHVLDFWYDHYLHSGYEGQMVRLEGPYEQKRSAKLLKRKEFSDSEFEVIDIEPGVGNAAGIAKIARLRLDTDRTRTFSADIVGTREEARRMLEEKDRYIGKMATVKYFSQRTPDGIPRFGKVKIIYEEERW